MSRRFLALGTIGASALLCLAADHALDGAELVIAEGGRCATVIVVAADAGVWERRAGTDLARCIRLMTGADPRVGPDADAEGPAILIGSAALRADPSLRAALAAVAKPAPLLRADAIALRRTGKRVYLAGSNDESHYFAVAQLLQSWG